MTDDYLAYQVGAKYLLPLISLLSCMNKINYALLLSMNEINYALLLSMNEINSAAFLGFEK